MSQNMMRAGMLLRLATFSSRFSFFIGKAPRGEMQVERRVAWLFVRVVVMPGLEARAAVGETPATADDDEPDEVERGDDASGDGNRKEVTAVWVDEVERRDDDAELEACEGDSEEEFGPAPLTGALLLTDAGVDEIDLYKGNKKPCHGERASLRCC
jgi:hypothetical protein